MKSFLFWFHYLWLFNNTLILAGVAVAVNVLIHTKNPQETRKPVALMLGKWIKKSYNARGVGSDTVVIIAK